MRYNITVTAYVVYTVRKYKNPSLIMIMRVYRIYLCIPLLTGPFKTTPYLSAPPLLSKRSCAYIPTHVQTFPIYIPGKNSLVAFLRFFFVYPIIYYIMYIVIKFYKTCVEYTCNPILL